jgi:hypothetical protein
VSFAVKTRCVSSQLVFIVVAVYFFINSVRKLLDSLVTFADCTSCSTSEHYHCLQDDHTSAWSLFLATSNAFGFWMDILSSLFVAIITLTFFILEGKWRAVCTEHRYKAQYISLYKNCSEYFIKYMSLCLSTMQLQVDLRLHETEVRFPLGRQKYTSDGRQGVPQRQSECGSEDKNIHPCRELNPCRPVRNQSLY